MRTLNKKQKKFLDDLYKEKHIACVGDMSAEDWKTLEKMNNHETLYQNADRHLWDLNWDDVYFS
jgi:hypothetical protein